MDSELHLWTDTPTLALSPMPKLQGSQTQPVQGLSEAPGGTRFPQKRDGSVGSMGKGLWLRGWCGGGWHVEGMGCPLFAFCGGQGPFDRVHREVLSWAGVTRPDSRA